MSTSPASPTPQPAKPDAVHNDDSPGAPSDAGVSPTVRALNAMMSELTYIMHLAARQGRLSVLDRHEIREAAIRGMKARQELNTK